MQIILVMANTDFVCDWSYLMHRSNAGENLKERNKIYKRWKHKVQMRIYAGNFPTITGFFLFSFSFHFQVKRSKTRLNAHICLFLLFFSLRFFVLQTFSYGKYYFGVKADSKLFRFFDCYANSHLENLQPNGKQNKTKSNEQNFKWISIDLCTT